MNLLVNNLGPTFCFIAEFNKYVFCNCNMDYVSVSYNINDDSGWRKEILLENSHAFIGIRASLLAYFYVMMIFVY